MNYSLVLLNYRLKQFNFQSEDEALAKAIAESERLANGSINNPQQRCSVS